MSFDQIRTFTAEKEADKDVEPGGLPGVLRRRHHGQEELLEPGVPRQDVVHVRHHRPGTGGMGVHHQVEDGEFWSICRVAIKPGILDFDNSGKKMTKKILQYRTKITKRLEKT